MGRFLLCVATEDVLLDGGLLTESSNLVLSVWNRHHVTVPQAKYFTDWQGQTENTPAICQNGYRTDRPKSQGQILQTFGY